MLNSYQVAVSCPSKSKVMMKVSMFRYRPLSKMRAVKGKDARQDFKQITRKGREIKSGVVQADFCFS